MVNHGCLTIPEQHQYFTAAMMVIDALIPVMVALSVSMIQLQKSL